MCHHCGECLKDFHMVARRDSVGAAIQNVARELGEWGSNVLSELEKGIKKIRKKLEECRRRVVSSESVQREEFLKFKRERLEDKKNLY